MVMIISEEQVKEVMEEVKKAGEMINNVGKGGTSRCMGLTVGHVCVLMNLAVGNSGFGHITFALSHMHWYPGFSRMSRHWGC